MAYKITGHLLEGFVREDGLHEASRGRTLYYMSKYMSQITIYLDDETAKVLWSQVKASGESASRWIAGAINKRAHAEWPADVLALLGSWNDSEFPDAKQIRKGYRTDAPREKF